MQPIPFFGKLTRKQLALIALTISAILLACLVFYGVSQWTMPRRETQSVSVEKQPIEFFRHPLTGEHLDEPTKTPFVYGVMIDNHQDARPHAGIDQSFFVIEAPVEAGIPRLLVFFYEGQEVKKIGPVRSARPYFLDWNNEFGAVYAHVGGSDEALDKIASGSTFDLNEYWNDGSFWRAQNRYAPHNTYTSTELLGKYVQKKQAGGVVKEPWYDTWNFRDAVKPESVEISDVEVMFTDGYTALWTYDEENNQYVRLQSGRRHLTESGEQVTASQVIVAEMDMEVLDAVGRRAIQTIGEGNAVLYQEGRRQEVTWRKASVAQRLRVYDEADKEIQFIPGSTWIEVVGSLDWVNEE